MARDEVRQWLVEFLLEKVRADAYPSTTHLDLIEQLIPCYMVPEYLSVLREKVEKDSFPSIPMLRRMRRVSECLGRHDHHHERAREEQAEAPRAVERPRAGVPGDDPHRPAGRPRS